MGAKIMLVEDDKSLREIYGVRLLAEGYDIVSAGDGEEALAVAIKERPSLIISDVMMPKISGFDMLDILRSTTETRNVKVIMMTALSSEEQRARGEQLGADRYLVKSQVGIEDVVRVVHEVLGDAPGFTPTQEPASQGATVPTTASQTYTSPQLATEPTGAPNLPQQRPAVQTPAARPQAPVVNTQPPSASISDQEVAAPSNNQVQQAPASPSQTPAPAPTSSVVSSPSNNGGSMRSRVIQPIGNTQTKVNINDLLDKELAKEAIANSTPPPTIAPTADEERSIIDNQVNQFADQALPGIQIGQNGSLQGTAQPVALTNDDATAPADNASNSTSSMGNNSQSAPSSAPPRPPVAL